MMTTSENCEHLNAIAYTEDGERYHGCRDCGEIIPMTTPTPHVEGEREHSPLPWRLQHEMDFEPTFILAGNDEELLVASCDPTELPNALQNAQFIVRCVNSHQALVEALRELVAWLDESDQSKTKAGGVGVFAYEGIEYQVVTRARAALAAVDGHR